jgi:hypothetical protein
MDSGLDHGVWSDGLNPPAAVAAGATAVWQSESGGDIPIIGNVGTGTEGHVKFSIVPSAWQPWFQIHPETVFDHAAQTVTAVARTPDHMDLFVIGFDNAIWSTWWDAQGGWNPGGWYQIHPETVFDHAAQTVTAVARTPDHMDLFVIGFDNAIWSTWWGVQDLYIYWDNPFVGLNRYHQSVAPGFGISFSGGKGNNTEATYTLQLDAPVFASDFRPSRNGFPFSNAWPSETTTYIKLPPFTWWGNGIAVGDASKGLCGGMVFAVRDYFDARKKPPQDRPSGPGDPVFDYIVRRLFDSFNSPFLGSCDPNPCGGYNMLANVVDFQSQMDPIYPDSDNYLTDGVIGDGRAWIMAHEAWPSIQESIDAGNPCPLGLVMVKSLLPTDLGGNHQVLVYGYQLIQQRLTLYIYDPNSPRVDHVTASLDLSDTGEPISVQHNVNAAGPIYSFFPLRYERMQSVGGSPL